VSLRAVLFEDLSIECVPFGATWCSRVKWNRERIKVDPLAPVDRITPGTFKSISPAARSGIRQNTGRYSLESIPNSGELYWHRSR
jgi:hypothetical protein